MTIILLALICLVFYTVPMVVWRRRGGELFAPVMIASVFNIITTVPYLLAIANNPEIINVKVRFHDSFGRLDDSIAHYVFVQLLGYIFLLIGLGTRFPKKLSAKLPVLAKRESLMRLYFAFLICFSIGFIAYQSFMAKNGGVQSYISNIENRAQSTGGGSGYILMFLNLLLLAVMILIYSQKLKKSFISRLFLIAVLIVVALLLTSIGGRKTTLQLIVMSFIVWHYGVNRFKRVPIKMILLVPVLLFYIVAIPILRSPDAAEYYMKNPGDLVASVQQDMGSAAQQFSYIDQYLLIVNHFTIDKLWLGSSYLDLLVAPIPSSIYPDKPPVDDGVYLRTIAEGDDVRPQKSAKEMYPSSYPPETFGIMYMNFWIPGVAIGMLLLGVIYKTTYLFMERSGYSLLSIIIYGYTMLNFGLSNLRIVQYLTFIGLCSCVMVVLFINIRIRSRGAMPLARNNKL